MPRKRKLVEVHTRPVIPVDEMEMFKLACNERGWNMTYIIRRMIHKVGLGDADLLERILS
jgi:hypothetical protein